MEECNPCILCSLLTLNFSLKPTVYMYIYIYTYVYIYIYTHTLPYLLLNPQLSDVDMSPAPGHHRHQLLRLLPLKTGNDSGYIGVI